MKCAWSNLCHYLYSSVATYSSTIPAQKPRESRVFIYPPNKGATGGAAVDRVIDVLAAEGNWNQRAAAHGTQHST